MVKIIPYIRTKKSLLHNGCKNYKTLVLSHHYYTRLRSISSSKILRSSNITSIDLVGKQRKEATNKIILTKEQSELVQKWQIQQTLGCKNEKHVTTTNLAGPLHFSILYLSTFLFPSQSFLRQLQQQYIPPFT